VLGLFGILEVGRGIAAPPSVGGDWVVQFDRAADCAGASGLRQPGLSISQSGAEALIALNDGRGTTFPATVNGATLAAPALTATIAGKPGERVLEGRMNFDGCGTAVFRAVRQASARKRVE
jgi:hypothetical protein